MKVLFIVPWDLERRDGTSIRVYNLAKASSYFCNVVYIASPNINEDLKSINRLVWIRIPKLRFATIYQLTLTSYFIKYCIELLYHFIKNNKSFLNDVDIVHIHWLLGLPLALILQGLWKVKAPMLVDLHGSFTLQRAMLGDLKSSLMIMLGRLHESFTLRYKYLYAHGIVGVTVPSKAFRQYLIHKYELPKNYVYVAPDAIDIESIEYSKSVDNKELIERIGEPEKTRTVAYVGSTSFFHGFHDLLAAFRLVKKKIRDVKLLLIVPNAAKIYPIICKFGINHNDVIIIENVPRYKLIAHLRIANVLVLPHRIDSQFKYLYSNKLLDYMVSGKPIVAYALPSVKELLQNYPIKLFVEPDNPVELAKGIIKMLSEQICSENIARRVYDMIPTLEILSRALEKIYSIILENYSK